MMERKERSDKLRDLRQQAEELAKTRSLEVPEHLKALSLEEIRGVLHELQVHQVELEMQNETLRQTQAELAASRARYFDLYDLAPMGYFTLSDLGVIAEVNLTAAQLLGVPRSLLIGQPLSRFISPGDQDPFYLSFKHLLESAETQVLELRMQRKDAAPFWVRMEAVASQDMAWATVYRVVVSDITSHKRMEETLRESENRFRALFENAPLGYQSLDEAGCFLEVNQAWLETLGYRREEVLGRWFGDFLAPEFVDAFRTRFPLFKSIGEIHSEFQMLHKNGERRFIAFDGRIGHRQDGSFRQTHCLLTDITERKQAEAALRESEERFRTLLQGVPTVAVQGYELDGTTRYWNQASERLYGYSAQEAIGQDLQALIIPPEMREQVGEDIRRMVATGQPIPSAELSLMRKDGTRVSVISSHAIVQIPGRPPELFCIDVDISERKVVEAAQTFLLTCGHPSSGEDFFRSLARYLAENLKMDYVCIDRLAGDRLVADTLAVFHDGACEPNVSYTLKDTPCGDLVGKAICCFPRDVRRLFPKDAVLQEMAAESYVGVTLWDSLGRPIGLIAAIGRQPLDNPRLAQTLLNLVGIRASAELELSQAEEERRKLETRMNQIQKLEALGFLAAGVSHNLNNVLAAILGLASTRETVATDAKDLEAFQVICKACERGREVLDSLLRFARPRHLITAPVELNGTLSELRRILDHTTRMRISVSEAFSLEPLWILGDAGSISHALMNLCVNAINAMPEGGVLTLGSAASGADWADVWVEDNGTGMPPDILAHAMEPFFTTRPVGEGTGLGLSVTYGAVKAHGGTMDLSSQPGQGTLAKLRFPRIPAPLREEPVLAQAQPFEPLQVLMVDDDELVRLSTVDMLDLAGCRATAVGGGLEALESLASGPLPDLVLLDLNMPGMDGLETLTRIRARHAELPVLIVSGQPGIQDWDCFKQPHVGVLPKPFSIKELLSRMAQAVPPRESRP